LSAPRELSPDEEGGELNIVPFLDIVTNVLMFVLATVSVTFTATIDSFPPRAPTGVRAATAPTLGLTVLIVPDGFGVKARGGNVAPGCSGVGPGISVPRKGDGYDYPALRECVTQLKASSPDFSTEQSVTISANPQIPYQVVVSTMDAVRNNPRGEPLFPDVSFGVAR